MHDPFALSFPFGRLFGITLRMHWMFPLVALGMVLMAAVYNPYPAELLRQHPELKIPSGTWIDAIILVTILFVSVLGHELAHCFAARSVGGEGNEILMWPLGGLANVEVPHRPRAHFLVAAAGPAFNLLVALVCFLLLLFIAERPVAVPWNPLPNSGYFSFPWRDREGLVTLFTYAGTPLPGPGLDPVFSLAVWLVRIFWLNWFLSLFNLILVGFPMDAGRMLQAALWPSMGYRASMQTAVFCGFGVVFLLGLYGIAYKEGMALALAFFVYFACQRQWELLETGGEDGVFGYDFSQGYTSLERDQPVTTKPRLSWWQRMMQRWASRRLQRELDEREAEERRLDALLDKVHRQGRAALTDEEERFMKRVADRYRRSK